MFFTKYNYNDKVKENGMARAYGTKSGDEDE
jgi:hypothetical protein